MLTCALLLPLLLKSDAGSLVYVIKRWPSGTRQLGRLCHLGKFATEGMMAVLADEYQNCLRAASVLTPGVRAPVCAPAPFQRKIHTQKLKNASADIMPLYLWAYGRFTVAVKPA